MKILTTVSAVAIVALAGGIATAKPPGPSRFPVKPPADTVPYNPPTQLTRDTSPESAPAPIPAEPVSVMSAGAGTAADNYWNKMNIGATVRAGTLGFGVEVSASIFNDRLNLRTGINSFSYDCEPEPEDDDSGDEDLTYDGTLDLSSIPLFLDYHPFKGAFRATAGLLFNSNEITANARCENASGCEFGDMTFTQNDIDGTKLAVDLGGTHPYLGIGWGNAAKSKGRLTAAFDIGVVFQSATVSITPSENCRNNEQCLNEVEQEENELQEDADDLDMYPVISFGIGYRFK